MADKQLIIRPNSEFQQKFTRTNVNVCFSGGSVGSGKSFGAALATAEPLLDPLWRGLVVKNNLDDLKRGGGIIDTFHKELYGEWTTLRMSDMPRITSPYGSWIDFAHLADQSVEAIQRRFKGSQYDWIYFDELTGFTWDAFKTLLTRNRGKSGYAGKCLATTNPERECWIRKFIDWYIGEDGLIMPERDGVVRYFYVTGNNVEDVVWGDSKEEVYHQCKYQIDKQLDGVFGFNKGRDKWPHMIRSFVFYLGRMSQNTDMLQNNMDYLGAIAMTGTEAMKLLEGNWNVSSKDEELSLITYDDANGVFLNDAQTNGDRWVTCDLADEGSDNTIMLAWDGLHIIDIEIITTATPKENAEHLKAFAMRHNVGNSHIIFDAQRCGIYINDYIPEAVPFNSSRASEGGNALQYQRLKDCCFGKLVYLIKNRGISCAESVASRTYIHKNLKSRITVQEEFIEEARVIRFVDIQSGKKRLMTKREMNRNLGRGRSMDFIDPCAMRMYPLLNIPDGFELENSRREYEERATADENGTSVDIFDDTNFGISYDF